MTDNYNYSERCIEAFVHRVVFKSWEQWIYEPMNRWDPRWGKRCNIFDHFATILEGDFKRKGYLFIYSKDDLRDKLLIWGYTIEKEFFNSVGVNLIMPPPKHRDKQKDKEEFFENFHEIELAMIYDKELNEENLFISENSRTYFFANLVAFLYRLIDTDRSPHIKKYDLEEARAKQEEIDRLLNEGILTVDYKGRLKKSNKISDDPYLDQIDYEFD